MYRPIRRSGTSGLFKLGAGAAGAVVLIVAGYLINEAAKPKPASVELGAPVDPPTPLPGDMRVVQSSGTIPFSTPVPYPTAMQPISALGFSPDGKWLAAMSADRGVFLFDTANPKPQTLVRGAGMSNHSRMIVRFSADSKLLTWFDGAELKTYDLAAQRVVATMNSLPSIDFRFVRGDAILSAGVVGGAIRLTGFDARTGQQTSNVMLPTEPDGLSGNLVLSGDGKRLAASMSRIDPSRESGPIKSLHALQLRDCTQTNPDKPQDDYQYWGALNDEMYGLCDLAPNLKYIVSSGFDPIVKRNRVFMHAIGSPYVDRVVEPYDVAYGFSPDSSALILGVAGTENVKHNWGSYRVTKWFWAEYFPQPRVGALPELKQRNSNLPLCYNVIAVSNNLRRAAYGDVNGCVWLGDMHTGYLPKWGEVLVGGGNPETKNNPPVVVKQPPTMENPPDPVKPKAPPVSTAGKGDLQVGDWAEYRSTRNGVVDSTRKLTVVSHDGNTAKVRYEMTRKGKIIPAIDVPHPLNEPFKEKGHTLPKVGKEGNRTIELIADKNVQTPFGAATLDLRAVQFRESSPITLDGQGIQRTEQAYFLCSNVPFGGLVRQRTEALIINNKPGLVTETELVRYGRSGKIVEGPLKNSGQPIGNVDVNPPMTKKENPNIVGKDDLEAVRVRTAELLRLKDYRKAATELQVILQRHPKDPLFNRQLALAAYELGDWNEVERRSKQLEELGPLLAPDLFRRGVALIYHSNREADALKAFEKYQALNPDDPEAWLSLAQLRLIANDVKGYRELLDHAVKRQPALQANNRRAAYLTARIAGLAAIPPADFRRDLALAEKAIEVESRAWTLHTIALVQARSGKYPESLMWIDRSIKQDPNWAAQIVNLQAAALVAHHQGRRPEALKGYQVANDLIGRGIANLHFHDLLTMRMLQRELDMMFKKK